MARHKKRAAPAKVVRLELYEHQQLAVDAFVTQQIRRFFLAWHRRAGKDVFGLDFARERMKERVGTYWHLFPFHIQAKRAIWKGIDARTWQRFIDRAFPNRKNENDTEMSFETPEGSTWQMLGSDNYDRMVGSNPCGVVFSEWALCDPAAWDYIRPILVENKGWVMFITTFRGRNHAYRMFKSLEGAEGWYVDLRTIADTHRNDGSPIVTQADIEKEIREGMDPGLVRQEFYCDPDAAAAGAVFARQANRLAAMELTPYQLNNKLVRVAWGKYKEGITAVAFQDRHVLSVNAFLESNLTDAVQAVVRRHSNAQLIHHAVNPDPMLFSVLDGQGVVAAPLSLDEHMRQGLAAAVLNTCDAVSAARESLTDFAMGYAPYRNTNDDVLTHDATCEALAIMQTAQVFNKNPARQPLNYGNYDKGII